MPGLASLPLAGSKPLKTLRFPSPVQVAGGVLILVGVVVVKIGEPGVPVGDAEAAELAGHPDGQPR